MTTSLAAPSSAILDRPSVVARGGRLSRIAGHAVLIVLSFVSIFPIYWMVVTSLRPANEIYDYGLLPATPSLDNYWFVLESIPIIRMLGNTMLVSFVVTIAQLFTSLLAAFAFARWRFPLDRFVFALLALTWLVPFQVTMIPNYVLIVNLGLLDTLTALIIPHLASAFAVMLLYQSMKSFPREVIEAARVDGASSWSILWQIVTPNLRAPLASLAILLFISTWNEYFWPLLLSRRAENSVVQIGLQMFLTQEGNLWGPLMAASTLACLPILVFYVIMQRQVIESFMKSGLR